jgi:hypothetical protein
MTVRMKRFLFFSVAIIVAVAWAAYMGPSAEAPDSCHRMMSAVLAQDVDGARYNVDKLCADSRAVARGL